ncbi:LLM class flavin-dependent oxidoreductase [Streptomyces sp. NPDC058683]|uniref:LLM class flavin-dependent oxidoreductase n=1 Tax=Streptomyces sp. NPDC058683 TaxID=3346597 RepID=UPI00365F6F2B
MTFSFGIFDSFDLGDSTPGQVIADRLDFAVAAENAGIEHYHVTEHHGTTLSVCPSPNLFLAALSQRTSTMRFGALVHVLPSYDPLRLTEEIATLDQMSHGRLDVGVGSGVSPYELAYFGVAPDQARALYAETLEILTQGLSTGRIDHRGRLLRDYSVELSISPVQRPHPPLWYASSNTNTAEWAGANNVNFVGRWNGGEFPAAVETYWRTWRNRQETRPDSTPPRVGVAAAVYIADSDHEALARYTKANDVFARQVTKLWHQHGDHRLDGFADAERAIHQGTALIGTAATVRDLLVEQVRQAPVNYFEATLAFGDLTPEEAKANLDAFATTVMPAVREAATR